MGPKRSPDSDLHPPSKLPKLEHHHHHQAPAATSPLQPARAAANTDFSGSVKKKLANSTRTGQACDRCKVRKIKCDGRPEGCSNCEQVGTPCETTDRITGRATRRGHAEQIETENQYLRSHVAELQAQLKEMGVEPRPAPAYGAYAPTPSMQWASLPSATSSSGMQSGWPDAAQRRTSASPLPGYTPASALDNFGPLPSFKDQGSVGDNYLGVSSTDTLLSHIKGTSLSIFGHEVDVTDYVDGEEDYDASVMSYNSFLNIGLGETHVDPVELPPYQTLFEYTNWYMRSLNPYTMLLHKPAFLQLVWRFGNDDTFIPSSAETVQVHMMLATLKYQISVRNGQSHMMDESHAHYRYALTFLKDLWHGHSLQEVQAMSMICHHLRNFPKPGAAWMMISMTFLVAIELGLHRSVKAWGDTAGKMDKLEIEMRKRIFWTLHALATNLCGKLGRPMPISIGDIDVEFPEPMDDCMPEEEAGLAPFHRCSFQVGIQISKYTVWSLELFNSIYSIRQTPRGYEDNLKRLQAGIRQWKNEIPVELSDPLSASQDDYIFTLYLEYWHQEFQLLLHHPAVCRSTDPELINSNLDKCLAASHKMLQNCNEMMKIRSLDIPWINTVTFIASIFTTLFIYFQRKDQMSSVDMTKLRQDMDQWIAVIGECGHLLGSGSGLRDAIRKIVDNSLNAINDSIVKRTATESLARAALQAPQGAPQSGAMYNNGGFREQYPTTGVTTNPSLNVSAASYTGVSAAASFVYGNGTTTSLPQQSSSAFDQQIYATSDDAGMTPSHAAALAAAASGTTSQRSNEGYSGYGHNQVANNPRQAVYSANGVSSVSPDDWRSWTQTYTQQLAPPPGEYLNTATTLMALGGREGGSQGPGQDSQGGVDGTAMQGPGNFQWPGIAFPMAANSHVGRQ
ncbi:hypothetical protein BS50DRAFT_635912 [Corynespora cassiicola Philippines]|uniref:Zn(2)-C6 fungal-type domain-containing protein n=1 Tax=Corynespora cassiicola Philippines TaxID=1448308 RepID=A0A2T2NIB0_CORCC|nr:hypothetical protein BS50DRAFT_635912 [Corynespora cassiicola Philippines]